MHEFDNPVALEWYRSCGFAAVAFPYAYVAERLIAVNALTASDLQHAYSWNAVPPDNPRLSGPPDSALLNRSEGYEVLNFINRFCSTHQIGGRLLGKVEALKVERMIRAHPGHIRSHANVRAWIVENWSRYL